MAEPPNPHAWRVLALAAPEPNGPFAPPERVEEAAAAVAGAQQAPPPSAELEALRREMEALKTATELQGTLAGRERALLKMVLEQSPQGLIVCDAQGQLVLRNVAAERIWAGTAEPGNPGWGRYETFHKDGRPYEPGDWATARRAGDWATARVLRTRQPVAAEETHFKRFDGTHGTLLGSAAPLVGSEGLLLGSAWVFTDISHLKDIEAENALLIQERSRFLSMVSHELGNVVTPLSAHIQLLESMDGLPPKGRESIEALQRNAERLEVLLKDVMEVARLQGGRLPMRKETVELGRLVLESVESFREMARQRQVSLEWRGTPGLPVEADPKRITQVLFNLLSNALKFTPPRGRVTVSLAHEEGKAVVRVRDTGAGVAPKDVSRLFRPFSQLASASEPGRGSGLGLYISKGIIDLHGGRIWCESEGPGKGATFSFQLPLVEPAASPGDVPEAILEVMPPGGG